MNCPFYGKHQDYHKEVCLHNVWELWKAAYQIVECKGNPKKCDIKKAIKKGSRM